MERVTYKYDFLANSDRVIQLEAYRDPDTGLEYVYPLVIRDAFKVAQKDTYDACRDSRISWNKLPSRVRNYLKEKFRRPSVAFITTVDDFIQNSIASGVVKKDAIDVIRQVRAERGHTSSNGKKRAPENPPGADSLEDSPEDIHFLRSLLDGRERELLIAMRATAPENIQRAKQIVLDEIRSGEAGDLSLEQTMQEAVMKEGLERKYRGEMEKYLEKECTNMVKRVKKEIQWPTTQDQWREHVITWQLHKQRKFTFYRGVGFISALQQEDAENK